MKKIITVIISVLFIMGMVSCDRTIEPGNIEKPSNDFELTVSMVEDTGNPDLGNTVQTEYAGVISIMVSGECKNMVLWILSSSFDEDGNIIIEEEYPLEVIPAVAPDASLTARVEFGEILPIMGISCEDSKGIMHHYYLSQSGMDGSAISTEYVPGEIM